MRQKSRIVTGWVIVRQRSSAPPRAEILRVPWRAGLGIGAVLLLLLFDRRAASSSPTYTNSHYRSGELRGGDSLLPNLTATRGALSVYTIIMPKSEALLSVSPSVLLLSLYSTLSLTRSHILFRIEWNDMRNESSGGYHFLFCRVPFYASIQPSSSAAVGTISFGHIGCIETQPAKEKRTIKGWGRRERCRVSSGKWCEIRFDIYLKLRSRDSFMWHDIILGWVYGYPGI